MPLAFARLSLLLSQLEVIEARDPPLLQAHKSEAAKAITVRWFKSNRSAINELNVPGAVALLSTFLPERRTDRVYGIQAPTLCKVLSRGLSLSASRTRDLQAWREPGRGDFAACVERTLRAGGPPAAPPVMLPELDDMLMALAGQCRFSDPAITSKIPPGSSEARDKLVGDIFKRSTPEEGKWLVRLILKNLAPVRVDEKLILRSFHFLLPDLLRIQNDFEAAINLLKGPLLRGYPELPDRRSETLHRQSAAGALRPAIGVKVGPPAFHKAWSIDLCLKMAGSQEWVLERKYDGEYCEIHVDLSRSPEPAECITIFSKSGKNSTQDRRGLHQTLVDCLRLGQAECKIKRQAILLGELVVYSDKDRCILPFDEIRKHVWRSGVRLGNQQDSQPHAHEHLAIVFFDLLLLDDEVVMTKPVEERRSWLREVYRKLRGRAMGAEWKIVDFGDSRRAKKLLVEQFAASIAQRCEGLVLKPCGVPYFSLEPNPLGQMRSYIKLKKDYMVGLGDDADFAVIGASYNAQQALKCGLSGIKWTDFHLGCLVNADEVRRFEAKPVFQLVGIIRPEACIPKPILLSLNTLGAHLAKPYDAANALFSLQVATYVKIDVVFDTPPVLEVLGSGYNKPANCPFFMLRHARVKKLHQDRCWMECISLQELQEKAAEARNHPVESETQETRKWLEKVDSSGCAFASSVIYLAPCIANSPYITEDLLAGHSVTVTSEVSHWDRDCHAQSALTETVSESQAYADMRKIVLVEANRVQVVRDVLQQIVGLNGGRLKERIDIYDWRVLEDCSTHEKGPEALKEHFIGATMFDDTESSVVFVSRIPKFSV
ncbi:hypothetical protein LTR36_004443 [Oleoguttula mirabilis]|uniref:ATP-dependent DNA ligase family profile domain-containing protein n=1 Tax=Oleoguttula mirabilis TaxID=1507867 RepID=A0AAV9JFY3_9PEZI|nr:hypothetical protein LTR36_004443 [Oleoguttula mirabilis]